MFTNEIILLFLQFNIYIDMNIRYWQEKSHFNHEINTFSHRRDRFRLHNRESEYRKKNMIQMWRDMGVVKRLQKSTQRSLNMVECTHCVYVELKMRIRVCFGRSRNASILEPAMATDWMEKTTQNNFANRSQLIQIEWYIRHNSKLNMTPIYYSFPNTKNWLISIKAGYLWRTAEFYTNLRLIFNWVNDYG